METENQAAGDKRISRIAPKKWVSALSKVLGKHKFFRWLVYGSAIGAFSGLAAGIIFFLLEWAKFFFLEYLAGYEMAKPAGEHLVRFAATTPLHLWLLVLLPAIGGLLSGLIVYTWAPEAEGHGTDAFIDAFHNKQGFVRTRVPFIKGIASVITLATGGSAGREGPIAQIGSGIGSWFARILETQCPGKKAHASGRVRRGVGRYFPCPFRRRPDLGGSSLP